MKKIYNMDSMTPAVRNTRRLPYPGRYHAMVSDVQTRLIEPLASKEEFCLIVAYKLIHAETGESFDFTETYSVYAGNPRTKDFEAFLARYDRDFTSDDDIIGITADVDIVNECIGGFMHPVISYRPWGVAQAVQELAN